ncbi:MAG: NAD-dependent epimerase/dehydratase family protein [Terriglobales bacterium]|jgi:dTDP-L-rhamnose 4-epimerase
MKALVTGGAGFIGSHISDALLARGCEVRVVDNLEPRVHPRGRPAYLSREFEFLAGDVRDKRVLERALAGVSIVFHAAAYQDYMCDYSKFFDSNVTGTALIFEVIQERRLPVERFILSSSQSVYGEGQYRCPAHGLQMPEARCISDLDAGAWNLSCPECHQELQPLPLEEEHTNPVTPYGLTKYFQERVAMQLGRRVGVPAVALRYSITQGARQSFYNAYSGICRIFTRTLRRGQAPVVYEDGRQQRDYVHIKDVVRANLLAMDDPRTNYQSYNVGTGETTTVLEYARVLARKMAVSIEPEVPGVYRVGDVRHTVSGISKLGSMGWQPTQGLDEIFADYLGWLDTAGDTDDYFAPAYAAMKKNGVVRVVQKESAARASAPGASCRAPALAGKAQWSQP